MNVSSCLIDRKAHLHSMLARAKLQPHHAVVYLEAKDSGDESERSIEAAGQTPPPPLVLNTSACSSNNTVNHSRPCLTLPLLIN